MQRHVIMGIARRLLRDAPVIVRWRGSYGVGAPIRNHRWRGKVVKPMSRGSPCEINYHTPGGQSRSILPPPEGLCVLSIGVARRTGWKGALR